MIRDDGPGGQGPPGRRPHVGDELDRGPNDLDALLQDAFRQAFIEEPPVDVGARHLWQLYRRCAQGDSDRQAEQGRLRRMVVSASLSIVVILFPGLLGQLSLDALPGDLLYPVKRHHESLALSTAMSWEQRDEMLVQQAERRLTEAQAVATLRPSEVLPAVSDVGAIMDELARSPVAATRSQVEFIRGDVRLRLAALVDVVAEPTRERISVAVDEIVTADGIPSPSASARQVARTTSAAERRSEAVERPAMPPAGQPPVGSAPDEASSASQATARASTGTPSLTPASPTGAAVPAPAAASEVALSEPESPPSATTPSTEPVSNADCVPTGTVTGPEGSVTASADAPSAAATAERPADADESAPQDPSAGAESGPDACATPGSPPADASPAELPPQESSPDDAVAGETATATDEDTDMPETTVDGEGLPPAGEQSPDPDAMPARPAEDEPMPAPVPRPGPTTSDGDPSASTLAGDGAGQASLGHTQPADAGASATP